MARSYRYDANEIEMDEREARRIARVQAQLRLEKRLEDRMHRELKYDLIQAELLRRMH